MILDSLRSRIKAYQQKTQAPWHIIEQDYMLSWILLGISKTPTVRGH